MEQKLLMGRISEAEPVAPPGEAMPYELPGKYLSIMSSNVKV